MEKHGYTPEEPSYMLVECGYIDAMILMANFLHGVHTQLKPKFKENSQRY